MVFSSLGFLFLFLPIVLLGDLVFARINVFRNGWLFVCSLLFYWIGGGTLQTLLLLASVSFNYLFAICIERGKNSRRKKCILIVSVICNVLYMCFFKYTAFLLNDVLQIYSEKVRINLPIGISFYTFQALSYIIDVYRGAKALKNPLDIGFYITFFPQLIAGPIVRYMDFSKEFYERQYLIQDKMIGIRRFLVGLSKKILIANILGELVDLVFSYKDYSLVSTGMVWLGAVAYTMQIYYDFSGYSDMAIGLGRIFGFHFKENFNYPYIADSITDFWRRWHISLSNWFRDYVYIPLGGARCNIIRNILNLAIVWMLTGMWHGANWTFLIWGLGYLVFLILEKYLIRPNRIRSIVVKIIYRVITLLIIIFLWVIFRADSVSQALSLILIMNGRGAHVFWDNALSFNLQSYLLPLLLGILFSFPIVPAIQKQLKKGGEQQKLLGMAIEDIFLICLFVADIAFLLMGNYNPFIYYMF